MNKRIPLRAKRGIHFRIFFFTPAEPETETNFAATFTAVEIFTLLTPHLF
jgi:hypothetical protein